MNIWRKIKSSNVKSQKILKWIMYTLTCRRGEQPWRKDEVTQGKGREGAGKR
jgi:hypothetical protein